MYSETQPWSSVRSKGNGIPNTLTLSLIKNMFLTLLPHFEKITFEHFPREENHLADALDTMSSMFKLNWDKEAPQITIKRMVEPAHCHEINTEEVMDQPWFMKSRGISRIKNTQKELQSMIRSS